MSAPLRLEFEEVSRELIAPYVALSRAHFGDEFPSDPDHTIWKHLANPQGPSVAHDLYLGTTLIGRIVYQIREFAIAGRTLRAGCLSDLLIHPAHRGLDNFLRLMKDVRRIPGLDFIYATPNVTSGPLYRTVLRFDRNYPLSVIAFPLRSGAILAQTFGRRGTMISGAADLTLRALVDLGRALVARAPQGLDVVEERPSDAELDTLGRAYADPQDLAGRRDARFHDWRLRDGPIFRTQVLYCRHRGALVGYVALRQLDHLGYRTCFIIDACFARDTDAAVIRHLRWSVLARARRAGCDLVLGIFMRQNPAIARFCASPLVRVPERHLPQAVDMWVQSLDRGGPLPDDPARYHITLADLDVF